MCCPATIVRRPAVDTVHSTHPPEPQTAPPGPGPGPRSQAAAGRLAILLPPPLPPRRVSSTMPPRERLSHRAPPVCANAAGWRLFVGGLRRRLRGHATRTDCSRWSSVPRPGPSLLCVARALVTLPSRAAFSHCLVTLHCHATLSHCLVSLTLSLPFRSLSAASLLHLATDLSLHLATDLSLHLATALSLPFHCLVAAFSLPCRCLFTALSLPYHCLVAALSLLFRCPPCAKRGGSQMSRAAIYRPRGPV